MNGVFYTVQPWVDTSEPECTVGYRNRAEVVDLGDCDSVFDWHNVCVYKSAIKAYDWGYGLEPVLHTPTFARRSKRKAA